MTTNNDSARQVQAKVEEMRPLLIEHELHEGHDQHLHQFSKHAEGA